MFYRADIDGLRALAVLLVVAYHAGFGTVSGGFIGVDVFFVISGYLITSILIKDLETSSFSIVSFYERRIRRIIPALYATIILCFVFAFYFYLPAELEDFGKSALATIGFVSNILFWMQAGYFDTSPDLKPLLHTWSLAVEEQFYIFFPILLYLLQRYFKSRYAVIVFSIFVFSLALSVMGRIRYPSATFFLAPTRAWELLTGSLLAIGIIPGLKSRIANEAIMLAGLVMIMAAALLFDYATAFPGYAALLPCIGAGLIIHSGGKSPLFAKKLLANKLMVHIGRSSYSLYLIHWPVFTFSSYFMGRALNAAEASLAIAAIIALAFASLHVIENPVRSRKVLLSRKSLFIFTLLSSLTLAGSAGLVIYSKGLPQRFENIGQLQKMKDSHIRDGCVDIRQGDYKKEKCSFGSAQETEKEFLVWGDSHAYALLPAIDSIAKQANVKGWLASNSGCPPLLGITLPRDQDPFACAEKNREILDTVNNGTIVFLVARWPYYDRKSPINGEGPAWLSEHMTRAVSEEENLRSLETGLRDTIQALTDKKAHIVLVGPGPEFGQDVPSNYFRFGREIHIERRAYEERIRRTASILHKLSEETGAAYMNPYIDTLCDENQCRANEQSEVFFFDNDHLSLEGAARVRDAFKPYFP